MPTQRRRTKKTRQPVDQHKHTNALIGETSPYLLQHAHNPVDWNPWGPAAFELARKRGVPIFLSIGYSTCYWCHVMERESFENEATAAYLNEHFVPIKVDREERPDVDEIYMAATVIMTGRGGWPMSCFLEPDQLRPFWCGTYFPDEPRPGMPSFMQVLEGMSQAFTNQHDSVIEQSKRLADAIREHLAAAQTPVPVGDAQVRQAVSVLLGSFDRAHGGFGAAPKFPQPVYIKHLLAVRQNAGDDATRTAIDLAVTHTLDRMAVGGLFDQIGGGFHRYSTDGTWTVPHFEKMLYDNAQLVQVYARAADVYDDDFYRRIVRQTLDYVLREMTHDQGGFFSAQDAEVNQREGQNYLWTPDQIRAALDADDADFAIKIYGLDQGPNFQDPHHPQEPASNVLRMSDRPDRLAPALGIKPAELFERLDTINAKLYESRQTRDQPGLDDKVIASWNGMMIAAFAAGYRLLGDEKYLKAALRASDFLLGSMVADDGTLYRAWRAGQAKTAGFLEDHAAVVGGLLAVHRARRDAGQLKARSKQLDAAVRLVRVTTERFGDTLDADQGQGKPNGFFDTRAGQSDLFVRTRVTHDGAVPSGSSMILHDLIDLAELVPDGGGAGYTAAALGALRAVSAAMAAAPISTIHATHALLRLLTSGLDAADDSIITPKEMSEVSTAPMVDPSAPPSPRFTPVEVYANVESIDIGPDHPAQLRLFLRIAPGYHILAAEPGPGGGELVPLRVHTTGGTGLTAYGDYPPGQVYGSASELRVHRDSVELTIAVEMQGDWSGDPRLAVTYQACSDTECLAPRTVDLDVVIQRMVGSQSTS